MEINIKDEKKELDYLRKFKIKIKEILKYLLQNHEIAEKIIK